MKTPQISEEERIVGYSAPFIIVRVGKQSTQLAIRDSHDLDREAGMGINYFWDGDNQALEIDWSSHLCVYLSCLQSCLDCSTREGESTTAVFLLSYTGYLKIPSCFCPKFQARTLNKVA